MRPFCRENMEYILNDDNYIKVMSEIIRLASPGGLTRLIEWKYFDKNHPENHNIRHYNEEQGIIEVFNGKEWISKPICDTVTELLDRLANDIDNFIGYAQFQNIKLDVRKFTKIIACPLQLDMIYIDYDITKCDEVVIEEKKEKIIKAIQLFLRKKTPYEKNSITK